MTINGSHYIICRDKTFMDSKIFSKNYLQWARHHAEYGRYRDERKKTLFLVSTRKKLINSMHAALFQHSPHIVWLR